MGNKSSNLKMDLSPTDPTNGLYLADHFLAREIVSYILTLLDIPTLAQCRLVCRLWRILVQDPFLWKRKTLVEGKIWPQLPPNADLPWTFYAGVYRHQPFGRNLINNPCGLSIKEHWRILSEGGDGFSVENPPAGSNSVPDACTSSGEFANCCFATSYHSCSKEQIIELKKIGIPDLVMDNCKPKIIFSELYAGRFDCGCVYECRFALLGEHQKVLDEFEYRDIIQQWEGREWKKVEYCFSNYPEGVRSLQFYHGGMDTQFWKGHYGSKFTAASIKVIFEDPTKEALTANLPEGRQEN